MPAQGSTFDSRGEKFYSVGIDYKVCQSEPIPSKNIGTLVIMPAIIILLIAFLLKKFELFN